jgi:hypothetical protein
MAFREVSSISAQLSSGGAVQVGSYRVLGVTSSDPAPPAQTSSSSSSVGVGLGVGLGIGLPCMVILVYLANRHRRGQSKRKYLTGTLRASTGGWLF